MKQLVSRAYNEFELNATQSIIIKRSAEDRLKDEIGYYQALPPALAIFFPRLMGTRFEAGKHVAEFEYYAYNDLGTLMAKKPFAGNEELWRKIFLYLRGILKEFAAHVKEGNRDDFRKMYIEKTLREYENLKRDFPEFSVICGAETLMVNGVKYDNFEKIWPRIKAVLEHISGKATAMHGDLCFSNILYGENDRGDAVVKLIDPRGSFGAKGYFGDYRYDFAKLFHSMDGGYEYIIHDRFHLEHKGAVLDFTFTNDNREEIKKIFMEVFRGAGFDAHRDEFLLLQGLIFIGMCARHYDSSDRQKVMYGTGVRILNEYLTAHP